MVPRLFLPLIGLVLSGDFATQTGGATPVHYPNRLALCGNQSFAFIGVNLDLLDAFI